MGLLSVSVAFVGMFVQKLQDKVLDRARYGRIMLRWGFWVFAPGGPA